MTIKIGNAPCSWGIEFPSDPSYPRWGSVLDQCADAGYKGIELGPIGYMPEDPAILSPALAERNLEMIGGVVFRAFHDKEMWDDVMDASMRTCKALTAHGAQHLVLIDSISARRAPTAGRVKEAEQMEKAEWIAYRDRISTVAKMGVEEYGLTVGIHAHAGGFMDFEPELERLLSEIDENILKICFDTGHHSYAGFDPLSFLDRYLSRISYIHFKDINPVVKAHVINNRTDFYKACGQGIFCNLGQGDVNFPEIRKRLIEKNFDGWCTVEQDCDPSMKGTSFKDALANRKYLQSIGF